MRTKAYISLFRIMFALAFVQTGCRGESSKEISFTPIPQALLQDGDIVFRKGTGVTSRIVLAADSQGNYSHTGIVRKKNEQWYVIHAVPGEPDAPNDPDRVKMETIESFFEKRKAISGAIMRVKQDSTTARRASLHAEHLYQNRVLFDHEYNLADTTRLYCTELIDFVYQKEGIDIPQGRVSSINIPAFSGDFLMPSDIAQSEQLSLIYSF